MFCDDAKLFSQGLDKQHIDILYIQAIEKNKSMTFKQFPAFLNLIAIKKFPIKDENESFLRLFDAHLYPLYVILYSKTNIGVID